ncbi:MAG: 4-alpha-glucanotransferase [Actinomycetaceae bacterium]|nr:4-alpha-glucanotransferase [Actinomycetaceae bacterium]MDY5854525.1 4-alpha-glucanotransferase [Arcanobacterium sp.]
MSNLEPSAHSPQLPSRAQLIHLADAYGIAHEYWEVNGTHHEADDSTLMRVLAAMGVDASTEDAVHAALRDVDEREWRRVLPECAVYMSDAGGVIHAHVPHGWNVTVSIELEPGEYGEAAQIELEQIEDFTEPREIDGALVGQAAFNVPVGLPLGYHRALAQVWHDAENFCAASEKYTASSSLISVPRRVEGDVASQADGADQGGHSRSWGMMIQLYSVRSRSSWGIGDLQDLADLSRIFGADGADFVLINPLHAGEPVGHMQPSPYLPVSRRFFNPIYIRPEAIPEWERLDHEVQERVTALAAGVKAQSVRNELIDRDAVWNAKRAALKMIFTAGRKRRRQREFLDFCHEQGKGLEDFALWCALLECNLADKGESAHGAEATESHECEEVSFHVPSQDGELSPELSAWHVPPLDSSQVEQARIDLADRVEFWMWLQWIMDEQLQQAQKAAREAGMAYGICHDLAVGVHPHGADVWSLAGAFATGMEVGAPPDFYNQQGQNWSQPPWNPAALAHMGYTPVRDMLRTILKHAGALRLDHVMGLFRLYWIPQGNAASEGTYVYFNYEAMLGIVLLEAHRAGAVVVGEDLGTVEPWIRQVLHDRGILGTSVFWFEKQEDGWPREPGQYRHDVLATVDTHDLPPAAGYWKETHVDLRARLGLLTEGEEHARSAARYEREQVLARLREHQLIGENPSDQEIIEALHAYVCRTPSQLVGVNLTDAVGEERTQNQPGTSDEYPNWRIPLADGSGRLVMVEELASNERYRSLIRVITDNI